VLQYRRRLGGITAEIGELIDDRRRAGCPLRGEQIGYGVVPVIEPWARSALDEEDRQILMLLLAGLTDASIASQMGLSMRTVQRRVRDLMDLAGLHTRLQLGWHAAQAKWAA
jgi:DNA-binding NarL/FixJ family response regulator